jgi:hypothetical protein
MMVRVLKEGACSQMQNMFPCPCLLSWSTSAENALVHHLLCIVELYILLGRDDGRALQGLCPMN